MRRKRKGTAIDIEEEEKWLGKPKRKRKRKDKWIQAAIHEPGAFTFYCLQHGYDGVTHECIQKGLKSKDPKIRARARLAKTLKKMSKRRKKHG